MREVLAVLAALQKSIDEMQANKNGNRPADSAVAQCKALIPLLQDWKRLGK